MRPQHFDLNAGVVLSDVTYEFVLEIHRLKVSFDCLFPANVVEQLGCVFLRSLALRRKLSVLFPL